MDLILPKERNTGKANFVFSGLIRWNSTISLDQKEEILRHNLVSQEPFLKRLSLKEYRDYVLHNM